MWQHVVEIGGGIAIGMLLLWVIYRSRDPFNVDLCEDAGDTFGLEEGWSPWFGGPMPCAPEVMVEFETYIGDRYSDFAGNLRWKVTGLHSDITAYRIHEQQKGAAHG